LFVFIFLYNVVCDRNYALFIKAKLLENVEEDIKELGWTRA